MTYKFPIETCEKPNKDLIIMQPFSAFINLLSCIIIIYFIYKCKSIYVKLLLISFLLFELAHTFSHIRHIDTKIQSNMIHFIVYLIGLNLIFTIQYLSKQKYNLWYLLLIIIIIDLYIWIYIRDIYMIISGLFIMIFIITSSYHFLPDFFKKKMTFLLFTAFILLLVLYNESINCDKMIKFKNLPYHAITEIIGLILFTSLSYLFVKWDINSFKDIK